MNPDVLVVGAGPVGLTMAAELARYGVSVRIVDKAAQRTDKSKALVLWSRSLELIDRMGCGASFVTAGLKATAANIIAGSRQVAHVRLDTVETPHPYALMLPQSETERLMEQHLNACGVQVERQVELARFVPDADKVIATLRRADGREETLEAAWLIGCDGAHSTVRHGLGMQFEGDTLPSDWILADVHLAGVRSKPDELDMFWHSDGALALFPISPGRYRVLADVGDAHGDTHRADPTLGGGPGAARPTGTGRDQGILADMAGLVPHQRAQGGRLSRRPRVPRRRRHPHPQPCRRAGHEHRVSRMPATWPGSWRWSVVAWPARNRCSTATASSAAPLAVRCWPTPVA